MGVWSSLRVSAHQPHDEAMTLTLLYDMHVQRLGMLRVAEHFTVEGGKITRIRQIHDTTAIRAAGLAG